MARSPSTYQQLLYSDERLRDILEIKKPLITNNGMEINDQFELLKVTILHHNLKLDSKNEAIMHIMVVASILIAQKVYSIYLNVI